MHHLHSHAPEKGPETEGITLHWAELYNHLPMWHLFTRGKGQKIWQEMLDQASLKPGERVLDVGCGPGRLTLQAKARVGSDGAAVGIDASPEMIAVARRNAQRAGAQVDFRLEPVEALSFADGSFDVVLSSLMMHHLPEALKPSALAEIHRVLKPGGRLVILDMQRPETRGNRMILRLMIHRPMPVGIQDLGQYLEKAGFVGVALSSTPVGMIGLLAGTAQK